MKDPNRIPFVRADKTALSHMGHKQTFALQQPMAALPPKANMRSAKWNVCFGPIPLKKSAVATQGYQ
jgi:hypothetical protein